MRRPRSWGSSGRVLRLFAVLLLLIVTPLCARDSVRFRGEVYVALDRLMAPDLMDGSARLAAWARNIVVTTQDAGWLFENGGDRVRLESGEVVVLRRPVLVLEGRHFIPAGECGPLMGFDLRGDTYPLLVYRGGRVALNPEVIDSPHRVHRVGNVRVVEESGELARALSARRALHADSVAVELSAGTALVARRAVRIDGEECYVVHRNDDTLESYVVDADGFCAALSPAPLDHTPFGNLRNALLILADHERGIEHGPREQLLGSIALTIDLCWSLRPFEAGLYDHLTAMARETGGTMHATNFVTGRWMAQHPLEMERLIRLGGQTGVEMTWGLHSWDHPKSGIFMNDYAPESLRGDTLLLERDLLEWGVVPSVYYRFPGLIHDDTRLREIIAMNLVPVDCDSWLALSFTNRPPTRLAPRDGSIILLHGNGNEPRGIPQFIEFMRQHPDWELAPLHRFISADAPSYRDEALTK